MKRLLSQPRVAVFVAAATAIVVVACSSSSGSEPAPVDPAGSCSAIASACHPYDKESLLGHECHELGHSSTDATCAPRKAECLAACPPREAGAKPVDGGGSDPEAGADGGTDGGSDAAPDTLCTDYCTCLADTCAALAGYPFAAAGSCAAHCSALSAPERACWPKWCSDAKASTSNQVHLCEHAWGMYDLDECP